MEGVLQLLLSLQNTSSIVQEDASQGNDNTNTVGHTNRISEPDNREDNYKNSLQGICDTVGNGRHKREDSEGHGILNKVEKAVENKIHENCSTFAHILDDKKETINNLFDRVLTPTNLPQILIQEQ